MTGPARDPRSAVQEIADCSHHPNHLACSQLGFFIVLFEPVRHMAIGAVYAQRLRQRRHGRLQLWRRQAFENLYVLMNLLGRPVRLAGGPGRSRLTQEDRLVNAFRLARRTGAAAETSGACRRRTPYTCRSCAGPHRQNAPLSLLEAHCPPIARCSSWARRHGLWFSAAPAMKTNTSDSTPPALTTLVRRVMRLPSCSMFFHI